MASQGDAVRLVAADGVVIGAALRTTSSVCKGQTVLHAPRPRWLGSLNAAGYTPDARADTGTWPSSAQPASSLPTARPHGMAVSYAARAAGYSSSSAGGGSGTSAGFGHVVSGPASADTASAAVTDVAATTSAGDAGKAFNPVFVSVGHKMALEDAVQLVLQTCIYRVPEPIRLADKESRALIAQWEADVLSGRCAADDDTHMLVLD
ncbi:hypothetical protein EON67_11080 [archaeon]|nr:MAG: hypothetical protein EON67_11080 [archaeon]